MDVACSVGEAYRATAQWPTSPQNARPLWESRYHSGETGWDLGGPSTPLKEYIDQISNKDLRILIPGGGRSWEAEYAHRQGFRNVFVIDLSDAPFKDLLERCPDFPKEHLIVGDFFEHDVRYDLILEQTFFCALDPALRQRYVEQMSRLLKPGGKLVGVLFNDTLNSDRPPFGGFREDYLPLFEKHFAQLSMETCHNSIKPRAGRELWLVASNIKPYAPIDCSLHDHYEAAATLRQNVRFTMDDGAVVEGVIVDFFHKDKAEWLRMKDGQELRLDQIAAFVLI